MIIRGPEYVLKLLTFLFCRGLKEMERPLPRSFPLPIELKRLRLERSYNNDGWCIWLMANGEFTIGTYVKLCDDGQVLRITLHPDGSESIYEVNDG